MGRGIVHPVDVMANQPWTEDLLDYLAVYLVDKKLRPEEADRAHRHFAGLPVAQRPYRTKSRRPTTTSSAVRRSSG